MKIHPQKTQEAKIVPVINIRCKNVSYDLKFL